MVYTLRLGGVFVVFVCLFVFVFTNWWLFGMGVGVGERLLLLLLRNILLLEQRLFSNRNWDFQYRVVQQPTRWLASHHMVSWPRPSSFPVEHYSYLSADRYRGLLQDSWWGHLGSSKPVRQWIQVNEIWVFLWKVSKEFTCIICSLVCCSKFRFLYHGICQVYNLHHVLGAAL